MNRPLTFEQRLGLLIVAAAAPGILLAAGVLWFDPSQPLAWVILAIVGLLVAVVTVALFRSVVRPLQTISNLLAALREEDFSTRASGARAGDALGQVYLEVNTLSGLLQEQRLGALEATALLRTVMEEIEVAVFTFDEQKKLKLVNRAGQKLLARPAERLLDCTAGQLGLAGYLEGEPNRTVQASFPSGMGRWSIRRSTFRQAGHPRHLLVIADLSRALREEERLAWQRLIRVLGHEINNSLAPIKSISETLSALVNRNALPAELKEDMGRGLGVIGTRADNLGRFMATYTQLARLPAPSPAPIDLPSWMQRVAGLETRVPVRVRNGASVTLEADPGQLEQLMINLLRNAADAMLTEPAEPAASADEAPRAPRGEIELSWEVAEQQVRISVDDQGPGLASSANLFVPFFTTRPGGSGIGLVLCRQIAEAHSGSLTLENRQDGHGCRASLTLPMRSRTRS